MGLEDTANLKDWDKRLGEQYKRGWDNYIRRRIHLDVARDLDLGTVIKTIFCQIFITHAALPGEWIDIIYGINFEYYKEHAAAINLPVPVQVADNGGALTVDDGGVPLNIIGAVVVGGVVHVDDNAGSLTVDGTFWQATQPVSAAALPLPAGAATSALQLPDGHNVTVDNAGGAAAVNIQDGGNVITVDAAALPLPAGAATSALQLPDGHNGTGDNAGR